MIIVNLKGGLGNQLFQYSMGMALAQKNQTELKIDTSKLSKKSKDTVREISLDIFNLNYQIANQQEINKVKYPLGPISKVLLFLNSKILRQFYEGYHPRFFEKKGDIYLDGYFQSEKNFYNYQEIVRTAFTIKNDRISKQAKILQKEIESKNSIAIHVRRGDYISNKEYLKYYGVLPLEYYRDACNLIKSKFPNPNFYIFSDDPDWVEENFPKSENYFNVSKYSSLKDYEEFYLMSKCQHNIIANSTFSWWSAWLNTNKNKTVIAPSHWNNHQEKNPHIIPDSWITI